MTNERDYGRCATRQVLSDQRPGNIFHPYLKNVIYIYMFSVTVICGPFGRSISPSALYPNGWARQSIRIRLVTYWYAFSTRRYGVCVLCLGLFISNRVQLAFAGTQQLNIGVVTTVACTSQCDHVDFASICSLDLRRTEEKTSNLN